MRIAALFLLPDCDLACRFCASEFGLDSLTEDEAIRWIGSVAAKRYTSVVLGGGEPLLWSGDLFRVGARAKELGLVVQLNTNGVAWREEVETSKSIDRVILPLDGATHTTHDFLRGRRKGHRALVEDRLRRLSVVGREVTIGSVICRLNSADLPAIAEELAERVEAGLRLHAWHLYRFQPIGRGGGAIGRNEELGLGVGEYLHVCKPIQSVSRSWKIYRRPDMTRSKDVDFFWKEKGQWRAQGRGLFTKIAS